MYIGQGVLDQQVVDLHDLQMGKVDGVVLEHRDGEPARVAYIVVGGTTLLWRIHRGLAAWVERKLGGAGHVTNVPWRKVIKVGVDIRVDADGERTPALFWERWVRDRIIRRIPGS